MGAAKEAHYAQPAQRFVHAGWCGVSLGCGCIGGGPGEQRATDMASGW